MHYPVEHICYVERNISTAQQSNYQVVEVYTEFAYVLPFYILVKDNFKEKYMGYKIPEELSEFVKIYYIEEMLMHFKPLTYDESRSYFKKEFSLDQYSMESHNQ